MVNRKRKRKSKRDQSFFKIIQQLSCSSLITALLIISMPHTAQASDIPPLPPVTNPDGSLGTCYAFYTGDQGSRTPQAKDAGSRWDRFDFRWDVIGGEQPGPLNFGPHEEIIARDQAYGLNIVGILGSTPQWAANCSSAYTVPPSSLKSLVGNPMVEPMWDGISYHRCPPKNLDLAWDDPDNYWANYVTDVVTHFKEEIDVWEIWNEPDMQFFWTGSAQEYAQLLKVGYLAVKAANPEATVLFGGLAYWENPGFYTEVLDILKNDPDVVQHNGYFDAMSLHLYANVYQAHDISMQVKDAIASRVGPHPIWLTETGVQIWNEDPQPPSASTWPPDYTATAEEAAWHVIEAYANARAADVERFFYFRLHDDYDNMQQRFGLTRDDYSLRPAYVAYQVAAQYLNGENQITGPFGSTVKRVTFWGTPLGKIDVLWNATPDAIAYTHPAILPTATLVTHQGQTQTLTASGNTFSVNLATATNNNHPYGEYIIGGAPILLIQSDTTSPTSMLHTLPPTTMTYTLPLTWSVSDADAGYWYEEIQYAPGPDGPWSLIAGIGQTKNVTHTQIALPEGLTTWYFRARARDLAGNWELWPPTAEISTTLNQTRTIALSVTAFSDQNGNGSQDIEDPLLSNVTASWMTPGFKLTDIFSDSWTVTQTVPVGTQSIMLDHQEHLPKGVSFEAEPGENPQIVTLTLGLHPIAARLYLPIIVRAQQAQ